jgi:disulfide bond formation protein DsbB
MNLAATSSLLLGIGALIAAAISLLLLFGLLDAKTKTSAAIKRYAAPLALLVAAGGTLASLFYSEVLRYAPCNLCWYQRILLYPQILILILAMKYKDDKWPLYIAWLSGFGAVIALYNHGLQMGWFPEGALCGLSATASCAKIYVSQFGFVTIPLMSFTGFVMNLLLALHARRAMRTSSAS